MLLAVSAATVAFSSRHYCLLPLVLSISHRPLRVKRPDRHGVVVNRSGTFQHDEARMLPRVQRCAGVLRFCTKRRHLHLCLFRPLQRQSPLLLAFAFNFDSSFDRRAQLQFRLDAPFSPFAVLSRRGDSAGDATQIRGRTRCAVWSRVKTNAGAARTFRLGGASASVCVTRLRPCPSRLRPRPLRLGLCPRLRVAAEGAYHPRRLRRLRQSRVTSVHTRAPSSPDAVLPSRGSNTHELKSETGRAELFGVVSRRMRGVHVRSVHRLASASIATVCVPIATVCVPIASVCVRVPVASVRVATASVATASVRVTPAASVVFTRAASTSVHTRPPPVQTQCFQAVAATHTNSNPKEDAPSCLESCHGDESVHVRSVHRRFRLHCHRLCPHRRRLCSHRLRRRPHRHRSPP